MSQETKPQQDEEDDYDVIIEGATIGDPNAVFVLSFGGKKAPKAEAPLNKVKVGVSLYFEKSERRIDVGKVTIRKIASEGPYLFAIPYDDSLFKAEVRLGVEVDLFLSISATDSLGNKVKFGNAKSLGNGVYGLSYKHITPQIFPEVEKLVHSLSANS